MNEGYLKCISITKTFGNTKALDQVTLQVQEGEFIFLLGPSGCGKTTLLRVIAGLEEPSRGHILHAGIDITRLPPSKRNFGIVFQSYALFPNLTVFQNVAYGLENRRLSKNQIAERVHEMLQMVGLEEFVHRYPAQLSGGQQQRVALARALAISPSLLLLDEPLSALDARVRVNLRTEITRLQRRLGVTTIMVSHDQEEALTMAQRIVVMEKGQIVQIGTPEEIYRNPATPFVADFVGLMNFLPGRVHEPSQRKVEVLGNLLQVEQELDGESGKPITLAIRPEKVQIARNGNTDNNIPTQVEKLEFIGPFYRLHLRFKEIRMIAYMPPELSEAGGVREGNEVAIHLPPNHLHVYHPS